jgi:hypothetical protein
MVACEDISNLHELLQHIEASLIASDGPRWFRGAGDVEHKLLPSLMRHPDVIAGKVDPRDLENRLNARFAQTSPPFLGGNGMGTEFDRLFTAQHFGVPTRLLDWSENPFIALYFALSTAKDKPSCVWVLDPLLWTRKALNNDMLTRIPDPADTAARNFLAAINDSLMPSTDPIAIFGNYTNSRIVAQRGAFTLFGVKGVAMEDLPYANECLKCYRIDPALKSELYRRILAIGYTHSVVYPDLSGLGVELKTSFGF